MAGVIEREPQQPSQPGDHLVGGFRIGVHQLGDGVQGVEEEMRLQLHFEHLQVGPDQPRLQLRGVQMTGAVERTVADGPAQTDDREKSEQTSSHAFGKEGSPELAGRDHPGCPAQRPFESAGDQKEAGSRQKVDAAAVPAMPSAEARVTGYLKHRSGQRGPDPGRAHRIHQELDLGPGWGWSHAVSKRCEIPQANQRPAGQHQGPRQRLATGDQRNRHGTYLKRRYGFHERFGHGRHVPRYETPLAWNERFGRIEEGPRQSGSHEETPEEREGDTGGTGGTWGTWGTGGTRGTRGTSGT